LFSPLEVRNRRSKLEVTNAAHSIDYIRSTVPGDIDRAEATIARVTTHEPS
jgi:hypothetical protein